MKIEIFGNQFLGRIHSSLMIFHFFLHLKSGKNLNQGNVSCLLKVLAFFFKEWASFQENVMTWHVSSLPLLALILSSFIPPFEKALLEGEATQCLSTRLSNLIKESCILQIVQNQSWVNLVDIFHIVGRYPWNEAFWYALLLNVQTIKINCFWFCENVVQSFSYNQYPFEQLWSRLI